MILDLPSRENSLIEKLAQSLLTLSLFLFVEQMAFLSSDVASSVALLSVGAKTGIRGVRFPTG